MKAQPECLACMFRQALNTARAATADPKAHTTILLRLAKALHGVNMNADLVEKLLADDGNETD